LPKYPEISVSLTGQDGNAFSILARVMKAMRKHGLSLEEVQKFEDEATSVDYDHLLTTVMEYVEVTQ